MRAPLILTSAVMVVAALLCAPAMADMTAPRDLVPFTTNSTHDAVFARGPFLPLTGTSFDLANTGVEITGVNTAQDAAWSFAQELTLPEAAAIELSPEMDPGPPLQGLLQDSVDNWGSGRGPRLDPPGDQPDITTPVASVPAPGAALLAGVGLVLIGWIKRRIN